MTSIQFGKVTIRAFDRRTPEKWLDGEDPIPTKGEIDQGPFEPLAFKPVVEALRDSRQEYGVDFWVRHTRRQWVHPVCIDHEYPLRGNILHEYFDSARDRGDSQVFEIEAVGPDLAKNRQAEDAIINKLTSREQCENTGIRFRRWA